MSGVENSKILFLASWYPTRVLPFNGNFIFKHARSVKKQQVSFRVLSVCEDTQLTRSFELVEGEEEGVKHLIVYYAAPFRILKYVYKLLGYYKGLKYLKNTFGKIDLVHVHVMIDAGFVALFLKLWKKIPYVITEHSTVFSPLNSKKYPKLLEPLIKATIKNCDYLLPVSNELGANLIKIAPNQHLKKIPNVVDASLFESTGNRGKKPLLKFLHISSFAPVKNIRGILKTVKRLAEVRNDFSVTIAGDGNLEEIKALRKELNVPSSVVELKGKMDETEVATTLRAHDVFVLFSDFENLPCVLIEAQMCGMPIISTDVGGVAEIVSSTAFGVLITPRDENELFDSMNKMIDDHQNYDSIMIKSKALELYSEEAVGRAFLEIYRSVLHIGE